MPRKLKVYGWMGHRTECPTQAHQTREIVAATSKMAAVKAAGGEQLSDLFNLTETGNAVEIAKALSQPGTVFWRPLNSRDDSAWVQATGRF